MQYCPQRLVNHIEDVWLSGRWRRGWEEGGGGGTECGSRGSYWHFTSRQVDVWIWLLMCVCVYVCVCVCMCVYVSICVCKYMLVCVC